MFHTFETISHASGEQSGINAASKQKRRTSTVRACEHCRRRKIRCNGEHPCETCTWYRKAETCHYTEPRQRQVPYQRSIEKISATLQDYRAVLEKLFPTLHPDSLLHVSRERLQELLSQTSPGGPISPTFSAGVDSRPSPPNPEAGSLEALQTMPEEASDTTDTTDTKSNGVPGISDDVNALSLSMKPSSSYLGISSVVAALRVICYLDHEAQSAFVKTPDRSIVASRDHSVPLEADSTDCGVINPWDEVPIINAYFVYVHAFVPLIDEQTFRETYMSGRRQDSRWLALLNVVLAMGSVAASTSDDKGHRVYHNRAMQHLGFGSIGSAHLETVQTLALLGGFYLHYIQQPNLAIAVMGATLRLATTLGLHREYLDGRTQHSSNNRTPSVEMRRRIWWCIFNLDAWATSNLGRPSMGRWGHAITVKSPQFIDQQQASPVLLLQEFIRFNVISTQIEDALAISPLIPKNELLSLDNAMVEWYQNLPTPLQPAQSTPQQHNYESPGITIAKSVMRWRYHLMRLSIHRPVLLWYALRSIPFTSISAEKQAAIEKCRESATELIADITSSWNVPKPCQISGWNATWLLYQASMVPLLSLFSDPIDQSVVERSKQQVEMVIAAFVEMRAWSLTAQRSLEVISKIYEVSKRFTARYLHSKQQEQTNSSHFYDPVHPARPTSAETTSFTSPTMNPDAMMDSMWDSLNWSQGGENTWYPFDTTSPDWEYEPATGWGNHISTVAFPFEHVLSSAAGQMPGVDDNSQQESGAELGFSM